jgi:pSer/pThr/pTyr-binding forkhead associated (FHA) protein
MPRLELIVQQFGKAPNVVPLDRPMVVGRSRRVDLTIDDEEVGREQFRIDNDDVGAFLEAIGKTNETFVDDAVVAPGMRRPLFEGTTIRVGRTTFLVRSAEATTGTPPPAAAGPEMTMVARGPIGMAPAPEPPADAAPPAPPPRPEEQTGGAASPLRTMPGSRPGAAPEDEPAFDQTMQWKGGPAYRPGQSATSHGTPGKTPPKPPPAPPKQPPTPPKPPAPQPPQPPRAAPAPPPAPPRPAAPPPGLVRPSTVAIPPADIEAELGRIEAREPAAADVEARVHEALPRVFVKCDGMKRRIRLMKARNSLGRAESTDVLLPNESVSELHAEITFDGTTWMLRDRGSTNGTFVDGAQLRGNSQPILRHSLLGLGTVRAIFLCNARGQEGAQRRLEERATRLLVQAGRLTPDAAREAVRIARVDGSQSIAEVLLMDTALTPAEWATAIATARSQPGPLESLRSMLQRLRPGARRKTPPQ